MFASIDSLRDPAVLIAFGGWNDAGDAATNVLTHLADNYPSAEVGLLDSEEFFDFQVSRPMVSLTLEGREITWPAITATVVDVGERDLLLLQGPEPNLRWRTLIGVLTELLNSIAPTVVVLIGAMLSDSPHTRPLPVLGHSTSRELTEKLSLSTSTYEGPTGIIGVLADGFEQAGLPVMSLWASVPHYVSNPPNPKAPLALLGRLSDVLGVDLEADSCRPVVPECRSWLMRTSTSASTSSPRRTPTSRSTSPHWRSGRTPRRCRRPQATRSRPSSSATCVGRARTTSRPSDRGSVSGGRRPRPHRAGR